MAEKKYVTFSMRLTPEQKRKIERLAQRKGTSQKEAVLSLVDEAINGAQEEPVTAQPDSSNVEDEEPIVAQPGSFLEGIEHIIGSCEGPPDLSTNPKYMEGYGR